MEYVLEIIRKCLLPVLLSLAVVACEKETGKSESLNENYEPVDVRVAMTVADYQNQKQTRGSRTTLSGDMGNEENTIHNITVFQFDGEGNDADPLVVLRYVDSSLDNLVLGLMQPKSDPNKEQFIYFVANTGSLLQNFSGTYGELKQKLISVNEGGIADGIMVMTCSLKTKVNTLQGITINFIRRLAKVNVTCSVATGVNFSPARLQLRNVPKSLVLEKTSAIVPEASTENFLNYLSLTENITNGYTWYMPENIRGMGTAADAKNKTASTAPSGQGDYCTYVELSGLYQESGASSGCK